MTHLLYRLLLVLTPGFAMAAAVTAVLRLDVWPTVLLSAAVACLPPLSHVQTRRLVLAGNTLARRTAREHASAGGTEPVASARTVDAPTQPTAADTAEPAASSAHLELRRELRMTRLMLAEHLRAADLGDEGPHHSQDDAPAAEGRR